jgi:EamA domain-containing membrane protein RarD
MTMATLLLWLALIAAVLGVVAAYVTSPQFNRVPWIALALAFFFASLLVAGGAVDFST